MAEKKTESAVSLINPEFFKWLLSPGSESGFRTAEQAAAGFARYLKSAGGDSATANANMQKDFGYVVEQPVQAAQPAAAQGQPTPGAPPTPAATDSAAAVDTGPTPPRTVVESAGAVQGAIADSSAQAQASLQQAQTALTAPGESGPIQLQSPISRDQTMGIGNPLHRVGFPLFHDGRKYPRTEAIERGTPVDMGNVAPEWNNYRSAIEDIKSTKDPVILGEKLNRVQQMFRDFGKWADEKYGPKLDELAKRFAEKDAGLFTLESLKETALFNSGSLIEQVEYHKRMMDKNNKSEEAKSYREAHTPRDEAWRAYSKMGRSIMQDMPVTAKGWNDVVQAYLWGHFNSAFLEAGSALRGGWNLLPGVEHDFWLNPRNPLYVRQTEVTKAAESVGRATGMFSNAPLKIGGNLATKPVVAGLGKLVKLADKAADGRVFAGIDDLMMKPGLAQLDKAYYRVSQLNPIGAMMGSAGTFTSKVIGRAMTRGFGAQLARSEAGQSVIRGVSEIVGAPVMRRWLGSKTAERVVEEVSDKAIRRMASQQWQATRLSPLRRGVENQYVLDAQATMITSYAANVRRELGKVLGDVDDATMQNMVDSMTANFTDYLQANPNLVSIIKHPFGASKFARGLQRFGPVDTISRAAVDGSLEGLGFGIMHLTGSIGPLFEQSVQAMEMSGASGADKILGIAEMTTKNWLDMNFKDTSGEGHVIDSMTMGFVFGTKGLGVGHLPWVRDRNFTNIRESWKLARAKGHMTPGEHLSQLASDGHMAVMERVKHIFDRAKIPFDPTASLVEQMRKITTAASQGRVSPRAVRRVIREMRGNLEGMSNKDLAMMAAISRENAARFPVTLRDGRLRHNTYDNIRDEDITILWGADDAAMSLLEKEKRQHIIRTIQSENRALELAYKGETQAMFLEDLTKTAIVGGAIFFETGGMQMVEALQDDENVGAQEIANLITHSMFSFMAGSHNRYAQEIPDQYKGQALDARNIPYDMPAWLKNRVRLSSLQAQMHYGGRETHPFIQQMTPEINAQSIHLSAVTGAMNEFIHEMGTHITNTQADGRGFFAVNRLGEAIVSPENVVPEGQEPITQNELAHGLAVLRALVASGVKLPKSFNFAGHTPAEGQEYIDFINNQENRATYLGHIVYSMRKMAQARGYLQSGEEFTADTFYRMTRLSAQRQIAQIATHVDYAGVELARLMRGISPGRSDVLRSVRFDGNQELTDQMSDLIELTSMLQTRYEVLRADNAAMGTSVQPGGDSYDAVLRMGRNVFELEGRDPTNASREELVSAAELAATKIIEQFHRGIHSDKVGVAGELRLGTPNGELKNSLYDAVELTGRFIAGELFHFRRHGGVHIKGGKRLTVEGVMQAAEAAGLFSGDRLGDARGRKILRPLGRKYIEDLMVRDPVEAIRLTWLHDTLSSMTDLVYTVSEDTGKKMTGMMISDDESSGRGAGLNPINLSKLRSRQAAGVRAPDSPYDLMTHKGGFWEALADAGIVITSREGAARITSDLEQLKDIRMPESDALGLAAIKQHRLIVKEGGHKRLLAPQVLVRQLLGMERGEGIEGVVEAIMALRTANKDALTPTVDADGNPLIGTVTVGTHAKLPMYRIHEFQQSLSEAGRQATPEQREAVIFQLLFGVNVRDYINLGERLIATGKIDSWDTDNGQWDGTARSFDTRFMDSDGQLPLLEMALRPVAETGAERARIVEDMLAKLKGAGLDPNNKKITKDVSGLTRMLESLVRIGDRASLQRVAYLLEGVGSIRVMNDGKSVFTINVKHLTQEQVGKMFDRLEELELGKGTFVQVMTKYERSVREARSSAISREFLSEPEKNKGVTFTELFKSMRISSFLGERYMQMFREVADSVAQIADGKITGPAEAEAVTDFIVRNFRRIFIQAGEESFSQGGAPIMGPVTKAQHEAGITPGVKRESILNSIFKELNSLSRTDYIGLFNQVVETESVYKITGADARALKPDQVSIPVRGDRKSDGSNTEPMQTYSTITEGAFSLKREKRKRDIERAFLDSVGAELSIDLDAHDARTNTSLFVNRTRLKAISDTLWQHGLSRPNEPTKPNVIDDSPRPWLKVSREVKTAPGNYGHLADPTPIVVVPWGDNKLIAIQVPRDAAGIVKMMTAGRQAWDATGDIFPFERRQFDGLYKKLMNDDGTAKFNSMVEAISANAVSRHELYNAYAHIIRGRIHGTAVSEAGGGRRFSMNSAGQIEANKRYNQLASDSYRKISDTTFNLAVGELLSRRDENGRPLITERQLEDNGIVRQSDGSYKIRVQLVAESGKRKRGGVGELDGNIEVNKDLMNLMAVASGYDPSKPLEIAPGMMWGGWKGFIFGAQPDGFNFMTKSFMTVMDSNQHRLARSQNVAMFIPFSSIKIGVPERGGKYLYRGTPITHTEAAARMARGQRVELDPDSPNIIEISPSDLKFQAMHDPGKVQAVVTAQMTQGWSPEGIRALLEDPSIFPARELEDYARVIFDRGLMGQAELRGFYEKTRQIEESFSPDDFIIGNMPVLDLVMLSRHGTAAVMFDKQMKTRIIKVAREYIAKGHSRHGGGAAMAPDANGDLKSTEIVLGPQARRALVSIGKGMLGIERTRKLVITKEDDGTVRITSERFTIDDADLHQQVSHGHKGGRSWNYNKPSESEPIDSVRDRETTWVDEGITQRFSIDGNGNIHGFLANVIAEAYAGGLRRNASQAGFSAPLYRLFERSSGHVKEADFEAVTKIINDAFVDAISNRDGDTASSKVTAARDQLLKIIKTSEGKALVDQLMREMIWASNRIRQNVNRFDDIRPDDIGFGLSPSRESKNVGEIQAGDLMEFLDAIVGGRTSDGGLFDADGATRASGYDYYKRFITENGTDLTSGDGLTPVRYGITGALQRSPSAKYNDTIPFHLMGFLRGEHGGIGIVNRVDAVDAMEADYDYDTFKYMFGLPRASMLDIVRVRNGIGPLGSQKGESDVEKQSYTYFAGSDIYGVSNDHLRYIEGQHRAAILKGQIISARAVLDKLILDGRGFRYSVGPEGQRRTYEITPKYDLDQMQKEKMDEMTQIYRIIQKILDTPGAMLPSSFRIKDSRGNEIGDPIDLWNLDVDRELFGRLYKKRLVQHEGTIKGESSTDSALSDGDYNILRTVRSLIHRTSSLVRDDRYGDEDVSRSPDDTFALARTYVEIFGDRLSGQRERGGRNSDIALREFIENSAEGVDRDVLATLSTFRTSKDDGSAYVDRLANWFARLGDAANGETVVDGTASSKSARALATKAFGDSTTLDALRTMANIPDIRRQLQWLENQAERAGPHVGASFHGEIKRLKIELDKAMDTQRQLLGAAAKFDMSTQEGRALQQYLVDGTVYGYAMKMTALGIEDTLDPRLSTLADMSARNVITARRQMWGIAISKESVPLQKAVKPDMVQDLLDVMVAGYFKQFPAEARGETFYQLAIRLLQPTANALYRHQGQDFLSYERVPQDILTAILRYDPVRGNELLKRINQNVLLMSDVFSGDPVVGSVAMKEQIDAINSRDGRVGERRTMLRNILRGMDVDSPIEMLMEENLTQRGILELDAIGEEGVVPGGTKVKGAKRILVDSIRALAAFEGGRGRFVGIHLKVDPAAVIDIPVMRELFGKDWNKALITTDHQQASFTQQPFYRSLFSDAVADVLRSRENFSEAPASDSEMHTATRKANEQFATIISKVSAAVTDASKSMASTAIIRDPNFDVRRMSDRGIFEAQGVRERERETDANCGGGF